MTSGINAEGRFGKQDFALVASLCIFINTVCSPRKSLS